MKDTIFIIVFILIIVGLGNSSLEVRDRAFIQSIAVYSDSSNVYTTVKLYNSTDSYKGIGDNLKTSLASAETRQGNAFFTGHTELIIFNEDNFSLDILKSMLKENDISPNCAIILSNTEVEDTELAYSILKNYDRLGEIQLKTVSDTIKELEINYKIELPLIHSNLTYSTKEVSI